jgi:beta-glucosidase
MSLDDRVAELLAQLTIEEKIALLHQHQPEIERLGLAVFHTGQEALHGMAWCGVATVFPQAIGLASTWNPRLVERVGDAVGDEVRAFHHREPGRMGLNVWAPVVDLLRDPRAGRNEEGYSEDPHLTGVLSTAYCRGLRGDDPEYLKTAPTLKHFLAYNNEAERVTSSSQVRPRLLHEYYLRAFEPAIASGAAPAVMLSYNRVNGRPNHVSPYVKDALREWNRDLFVVSDAFAPSNLVDEQHYFDTHEESHAAALRAGVDSFTDKSEDSSFTIATLSSAYARGLVDEALMDEALGRCLRLRIRLGELDDVPQLHRGPEVINCVEHRQLAREAAADSIVLLRNDGLLPLDSARLRKVAVVGPLTDMCLEDWYSGTLPYAITPLDGLRERQGGYAVDHARGVDTVRLTIGGATFELEVYDWGEGLVALRAPNGKFLTRKEDGQLVADQDQPNGWVVQETFRLDSEQLEHVASGTRYALEAFERTQDGVGEAAALAGEADLAIVVVGNHPLVGARETTDRAGIELPDRQAELIKAVVAANPRTVLVVESSFPYALPWEDEHVPAILWMSHGGQETGHALADVLFGDRAPAGRLTQTWYRSTDDLSGIGEYDLIKARRTYLYTESQVLYPFGHGLGYTTFGYANLAVTQSKNGHHEIVAAVDVANTGKVPGVEVVQVYLSRTSPSRVAYPVRRLVAFERVELEAGESTTVRFTIPSAELAHWDVRQGRMVVESGEYSVQVGGSATDVRGVGSLTVAGERLPDRDPRQRTRAVDFDDYERIEVVDETKERGDAVLAKAAGAWIAFHDVAFAKDLTTLRAKARGMGGSIEVRVDDPVGGPVMASISCAATEWTEVTGELSAVEGRHDLYVVLGDRTQLAELWFA